MVVVISDKFANQTYKLLKLQMLCIRKLTLQVAQYKAQRKKAETGSQEINKHKYACTSSRNVALL